MVESTLVRQIKDPLKKEDIITPIEMDVYTKLIKAKPDSNDNRDEIAEDLFDQLIDKKEIDN